MAGFFAGAMQSKAAHLGERLMARAMATSLAPPPTTQMRSLLMSAASPDAGLFLLAGIAFVYRPDEQLGCSTEMWVSFDSPSR